MSAKEIIGLIGAVVIVLAFVLFYPTRPHEKGNPAQADAVDWSAVEDDRSEQLTIRWLGPPVYANGQENTWVQGLLEERFNIRFEPVFLDWTANSRLKPLMFSAGDVPDVSWDGDPLYVRRNIHHGFVMELPYEVILQHAPTYVKYLNQYGRETWLFAFYRGKNYGIPTFAAADIYPTAGLWRMDWLRRVGLAKVPETLDEMGEALRRFRHGDPDGNGIKDTYGMYPRTHWSLAYADVFATFGLLPQDFVLRQGKVVWGGVQPDAKEALRRLRRWYAEELIDPDFAIAGRSGDQSSKKFQNGKIGYLYKGGSWLDLELKNPNSTYSVLRQLNPDAELAPSRVLAGFDGHRRDRVWGGPAHVMWFGTQVAQTPQKVLRVLHMLETLATDQELFVQSRLGQRGRHWDMSAERGAYLLPPYDRRGADTRHLVHVGLLENAYGFFSACAAPLQFTRGYLPEGMAEFRDEYSHPSWGLKNAIGKSDVVDSAGRYLEDLRHYQATVFTEIIRGDRPLDDFEPFVATWRQRGGDILVAEANEMLRQMYDIYDEVGIDREGTDGG
ncbi:MAG: hypothetical protein OSB73_09880 [Candidatus Latescibacteria bacterium]|nr:hypothetical protein [Candidatus Latescibacterota bacterium]